MRFAHLNAEARELAAQFRLGARRVIGQEEELRPGRIQPRDELARACNQGVP